jgi:hypothetical protein
VGVGVGGRADRQPKQKPHKKAQHKEDNTAKQGGRDRWVQCSALEPLAAGGALQRLEKEKTGQKKKRPRTMQGAAATSKPVVPFGTFVTVVVPARLFFRPTRVGPRFSKLQQTGSGAQADECTPSRFKTVRGGNLPANPDQSVSPAPPPS